MKIIVTGAAGAIGSHLAERLLLESHEVIGIDALTPYYDSRIKEATSKLLESKGVKMHYKNLLDEDVSSIFDGVEAIFHLAAQPGISTVTPFDDYLNNNIIATYKLLEIAQNLPSLKVFINGSTSSVYGTFANGPETTLPAPSSYYGVTKLAGEQLALSYYRDKGLPVVNARFFSVLGERERPEKFFHKLIKALFEDKEITIYEGSDKHVRSYTYAGDIVEGIVKILENYEKVLGETFNLGNDKTNTTGEGLKMVEEIMGKKAKVKVVPKRAGDQLETGAKIDKARKLLGYEPKIDLKTALEREVEWYGGSIHGKY